MAKKKTVKKGTKVTKTNYLHDIMLVLEEFTGEGLTLSQMNKEIRYLREAMEKDYDL